MVRAGRGRVLLGLVVVSPAVLAISGGLAAVVLADLASVARGAPAAGLAGGPATDDAAAVESMGSLDAVPAAAAAVSALVAEADAEVLPQLLATAAAAAPGAGVRPRRHRRGLRNRR